MLTFKYIPHHKIKNLSSDERIEMILDYVKEHEIVLLEGTLRPEEETNLIAKTMESIGDSFKGIEISVIHPRNRNQSFSEKLRTTVADLLLGDSYGFTLVGSADVIKEITQDPDKLQFFAEDVSVEKDE